MGEREDWTLYVSWDAQPHRIYDGETLVCTIAHYGFDQLKHPNIEAEQLERARLIASVPTLRTERDEAFKLLERLEAEWPRAMTKLAFGRTLSWAGELDNIRNDFRTLIAKGK